VGSVQQAVLEFDAAVQAPWRPTLRCVRDESPVEAVHRGRRAARPGPYRDRVGWSQSAAAGAHPAPAGRAAGVPARGAERPAPRTSSRAVRGGCARPGALASGPVRRAPAPVRLTRRARRLAVVLLVAVGVALGSWLGPLLTGGEEGDLRLAGVSTVVVGPGDTLWSVASSIAGDRDVRAVVDDIQRLNRLDGTQLVPGQVLQLP
jgi:hypothetical protein